MPITRTGAFDCRRVPAWGDRYGTRRLTGMEMLHELELRLKEHKWGTNPSTSKDQAPDPMVLRLV